MIHLDLFDVFLWSVYSFHLLASRHYGSHSIYGSPIHVFRANYAGEYIFDAHWCYLANQGTLLKFSCLGTHAQNGVAEHKLPHILETACALLISAHLTPHFWAEAVFHRCFSY
jgi:hypothetical protein